MNRPTGLLLTAAAVNTLYAAITFAADMAIDFEVSALTASACLSMVIAPRLLGRVIRNARSLRRRRAAAYRAAVWHRREREAYGARVPEYPDSIPLDGKPYRHLTLIDGAIVCIPKIAPALGTDDVAAIRAAIRVVRDV